MLCVKSIAQHNTATQYMLAIIFRHLLTRPRYDGITWLPEQHSAKSDSLSFTGVGREQLPVGGEGDVYHGRKRCKEGINCCPNVGHCSI